MRNTAKLSGCRNYRYALWRTWDEAKPVVLFVGLNPSSADEHADDPTLRRCVHFARAWGYGGVSIGNLFAYRSRDPGQLKAALAPVGRYNDSWLRRLADDAALVVAAWGNGGALLGRSRQVRKLLPNPYCLKLNKSGEPAHPLYLASNSQPVPMTGQ